MKRGAAKDLSANHIVAAIAAAKAHKTHPERNTALIYVSVGLGLRAAEIAALNWSYVLNGDKVGNEANLPPEAQKYGREVVTLPLEGAVRDSLQKLYAAQSAKRGVKPTDPIFVSQKGGRLTAQSLVDHFRKVWAKANAPGRSSHSGRRYFITQVARTMSLHGGSMSDVKALARHKHLSTTLIYIAESTEAQRAAVKNLARGIKF